MNQSASSADDSINLSLQSSSSSIVLPEYDFLFKILIIGDSGTGKSSLLIRFCDDYFSDKFISTIGVDFKIKTIALDDKLVKLQIWDSAGQERFRTLTTTYYRGAHAIIIVYDISDRNTFVNVGAWLGEITKSASENILIALVGNKCDKADRQVEYETAKAFADRLGVIFLESSAKEDINIQTLFYEIALELRKKLGVDLKDETSQQHQHHQQKQNNLKLRKISYASSDIYKADRFLPQCCGMR